MEMKHTADMAQGSRLTLQQALRRHDALLAQRDALLEALETVTGLLEHWSRPGNKALGGSMRELAKGYGQRARAAIAAARGEG